MNKKRKTIYRGSATNWAKMMNTIFGPNCKFTPSQHNNNNLQRDNE